MRSDSFPAVAERQTVILREATARVARRCARYRFSRSDRALPQYYIEIEYAGERAATCLGTDGERAARIFDLLVRGRVTPCTLCDIVKDMDALGEI